jgi:O-methyltransferase
MNTTVSDSAELYLDLMKKTLTYLVYGQEHFVPMNRPQNFLKAKLYDSFRNRNVLLMRPFPIDREVRSNGRDWPPVAYTMVGLKRLDNLQQCATDVLRNSIPGDFIEAGTWRGGAAIFLRSILKAYGIENRFVYVADSFEGLPPADTARYPVDTGFDLSGSILAVSLDQVKLNFSRFGLLDDQVRFLKGWFKDTLPRLTEQKFSLIRLDGDMYESTMDSLRYLYPRLSIGGYIVIDDYGGVPFCREAVKDYRDMHQIKEPIQQVDWTGVYWQKENEVESFLHENTATSVLTPTLDSRDAVQAS